MKLHSLVLLTLLAPVLMGAPEDGPATVKARKGTIRRTLESKGTFVPAGAAELSLWPEAFRGELMVLEARPHGTFVNKGDVVLRLESRSIDEQIASSELALTGARLKMSQRKENLRLAEESNREKLASAERAATRARQTLESYESEGRQRDEERLKLSVRSAGYRLEDMEDELNQLRKMYREDELVDATEEIIIKRSERNFASRKATKELNDREREATRPRSLAWRLEDLRTAAASKDLALEQLRKRQAMGQVSAAQDLKRAEFDLGRQAESLARLRRDRELFVVRAPSSGLLIHGKAEAAPWAGRLEKGSRIQPRGVFMSVADPKALKTKTTVSEKDILGLRDGLAVEVAPHAAPKEKVTGRLKVEFLPSSAGKDGRNAYRAFVEYEKTPAKLRAGMKGKVTLVLAEARDAILIPVAAVERSGTPTVQVQGADGTVTARAIVVGVDDGKEIAVVQGLSEGEVIVLGGGK